MACEGAFHLSRPRYRQGYNAGQVDEHCALYAAGASRGISRVAKDIIGGGTLNTGQRQKGLVAGLNAYLRLLNNFWDKFWDPRQLSHSSRAESAQAGVGPYWNNPLFKKAWDYDPEPAKWNNYLQPEDIYDELEQMAGSRLIHEQRIAEAPFW